jgi:UDP-GlcNAc:undecaprenyl-phosphate GlcNAc-1-phosphate transferase
MVGVLDDVFDVSAMVKLFALAAGCAVLAMYGIGLNRTPWPLLNFALTFLWVAGVASAFNAIDNKDGLAGVICFISAVSLLLFGWSTWQKGFAFLAAALAGSVLGFLHFNWPPARIYMGDAGSFFIGYVLAVLVIFGEWSDVSVNSLISGFLVVAVPVYDLALTTLLRIRHGVVKNVIDAIACSDSDHISHRLLALGVSHGGMLAIFGAIALLCSGVAAMVRHLSPAGAIGAAALLTLGFAAFGWYLDRNTSKPELWRQHARALHSAETSNDASAAR